MSLKLFGVDLKKVIGKAMPKGKLPALVLIKITREEPVDAPATEEDEATETEYTCRGVSSTYDQRRNGGQFSGDREIMIIADSLPAGVVPENQDKIRISSENDEEYVIEGLVSRDPAGATYICICKGPLP